MQSLSYTPTSGFLILETAAALAALVPLCSECVTRDGLCARHAKSVLPQLAQPHWYRLVGQLQLCTCGHSKSVHRDAGCADSSCQCTKWTLDEESSLDAVSTESLAPVERKQRKRDARKRHKRAATAAIKMQEKRTAKRTMRLYCTRKAS